MRSSAEEPPVTAGTGAFISTRLRGLARSGFVHVLTAQGATRVFVAVQGILLARILGPDDLGRFALLASALSLSGVVAQGGVPSALSRYLPLCSSAGEQERLRDTASFVGVVWAVLVGMVMALPLTGQLLSEEPWVRSWLLCAVLVLPVQTSAQASLSLLHGQARFPKKSVLETVVAAVTFALVLGGSLARGLSGAALGKVGAAVAAALIVSQATGLRFPRSRAFPPGFRRFALLSLASGSFSTLLHTADTLVLGVLRIAPASIGSYRVASLLYAFLSMVPAAAMHTLFPRLVRLHDDPCALRRLCLQSLRYLTLFGVVAAGAGMLAVPLLVKPLAGPEYLPGVPYVRVLSLGLVFRAVVLWAGTVILAMGRPGLNLILLVVSGAVNLALNVALVTSHGPIGAAWATVASEAASALLGGGAVLVLIRAGRRG